MKNYAMSFSLAVFCFTTKTMHAQENIEKQIAIQNEKAVNTALLDFSPSFYEDGIVYISSQVVEGKEKLYDNNIGRKTMSIFRARRGSNGNLLKPELFANELVSFDTDRFQNIIGKTGYVRKYYEMIKNAVYEGLVDRFFATGVSPLTVDSLTSGFNITTSLALELDFHNLMGFTKNEVVYILHELGPAFRIVWLNAKHP